MDRSAIYGNWRAQVVNNKDREKFGRVLVWIPDLMPEVSPREGIWARPANNPIGGRNMESKTDHHYMGSSYIPKEGAWLFVFFEGGNINLPYYFGALDLENTPVLPENQVGSNYEDKWTLFKSHVGRAIVISDDPDDERTEITGKKRQLKEPPSGDKASVYTIDDNQTTILLDERNGKQKLLIRTYKGDFINIDIEDRKLFAQFESDIEIKTNGKFKLTAKESIDIKSTESAIYIEAESDSINIKAGDSIRESAGNSFDLKAGTNLNYQAGTDINGLAGGNMNHDACQLNEQTGLATGASTALAAQDAEPEGERDS
jgi:hypothetical protein